jgi:hypothetical protein
MSFAKLGALMHAKFMHELCNLLLHIPTYLDVVIMFCIDLWGFSIDPPYLGYNTADHETPVLYILTFHGSSKTQIERGFCWS